MSDLMRILIDMEREDIAKNVARQTVERARFGVCEVCGFTLDGRWGTRYCRQHAEQELPLGNRTAPPDTAG